ncbi:MAG: hypothetical protein QG657_2487 [Acidobacteriota bacterium]|nr:hypothetical protein [Acidobacteriota bacterium]
MAKSEKKYIEDILGLSSMQEGMLYHYLKEPGANLYFEQLCLDISGAIDIDRFENAWNWVIQTNEMLRTVFRWEGLENPIQMVLKEHHLHPHFYDFSGQNTESIQKSLETLKVEDRNNPFDLTDVPFRVYLCKTGPASYEMIVSYHHILYDGWSNGIILEEFLGAYHDLCAGKELKKKVKTKFKEFVAWLQHADRGKQNTYWSNYLSGFDTPTELAIKKRKKGQERTAANFQTHFDKSIKDQFEDFIKAQRITVASLFYCSWGILLQRYNNSDDVVFGATVSGRASVIQGIEQMVGLFINTIPLRIQCFPGEKISELLRRINNALEEREAYENTPLVEISLGEERFDSIVVIENYPMNSRWNREKYQLMINSYAVVESTHYDLTLGIELFDDIEINFNYREQAFEKEDIERLAGHFSRIIQNIMDDPGKEISQIEMLSGEEKHQLLHEWNNTDKPYPRDKTIHQLFEEQAAKTPDHIAIVGQTVRVVGHVRPVGLVGLSYNELNEQSDHLAGLLIPKGVLADNIVAIMTERSIETIITILGILKSGGAYLPIDPEYPRERIDYMLADSNARILIGREECQKKIIVNCKLLIGSPQAPLHHSNQLAYIIYTSGSTGNPKGVMIEHKSLVNFVFSMYRDYREGFDSLDKCLSLTNFCFDVSVCEIFMPLVFGASIFLLSQDKVMDPSVIAGVIIQKAITFTYIPPGFLREIYEYIKIELRDSGFALALNKMLLGVDPIQDYIVEDYLKLNPALQIINGYGPTESTICATAFRYESHEPGGRRVPIGRPLANMAVILLDKHSHLAPVGLAGELYTGGDGLARGYLNNPGLTASRFKKYRSYRTHRTYIFYKTGDLARRLSDGNIEFLGRIDFQVKIRGHRVEPGEIENRLRSHKNIKEAVVLVKDRKIRDNEDKYLCAYVVGTPSLKESELREFLAKSLPAYMIPAYFVFLEKIPLLSSGKVNRKTLPDPVSFDADLLETDVYTPPRDEIERKLVTTWTAVLGEPPAGRPGIGIDDNFFKLGGHSIKAAKLVLKIHKQMNIKVPVNVLFENPTIRGLAGYIKKAEKEKYTAIPPAEEREYYPLTAGQKQFYITRHAGHDGAVYNVQNLVQLEGKLSPNAQERLENVFKELIHRHESLRTSFEIIGDEPVQRIHKEVEFKLRVRDQGPGGIKSFVRPFDLSKAPLLRVGLIKTGEETHILITDMHHIIADDLSMGLLVKEFIGLYRGEELTPPQLQYRDFALWQTGLSQKPVAQAALKRQEMYWLNELNGDIPLLNLPLDFPRPLIRQYKGDSVLFEIDRDTAGTLKKLAAAEGVTLYILMLTMFTVLLSRLCDQEDILVGTPIAGRQHPDLETIIGFFATMLVIRSLPGSQKTFREFLQEIKDKTLAAYENQDYTYEEMVDKLSIRNPDRNALFDVVFVWEDLEIDLGDLIFPNNEKDEERLKLKLFNDKKISAPFDLILTGAENQEKMSFFINYSVSLFKRETIERIAADFIAVIAGVLKNPDIKLGEIEVAHDLLEAIPQALMEESGDFGF